MGFRVGYTGVFWGLWGHQRIYICTYIYIYTCTYIHRYYRTIMEGHLRITQEFSDAPRCLDVGSIGVSRVCKDLYSL